MSTNIYMWMAITFGVGLLLVIVEYMMSSRKPEGFTPADRQRCKGMFWLGVFGSLLVGAILWMLEQIE